MSALESEATADLALADEGPCNVMRMQSRVVCGQPGTAMTAMCRHEHLRTGYHCARHAANTAKRLCRPCWELGHHCALMFW